jgi:hypothetical protein
LLSNCTPALPLLLQRLRSVVILLASLSLRQRWLLASLLLLQPLSLLLPRMLCDSCQLRH